MKKAKRILWFLIILAVFGLTVFLYHNVLYTESKHIEYFTKINGIIKDEDFNYAEIGKNIELMTVEKGTVVSDIKKIPFEDYDRLYNLKFVSKANDSQNVLLFVQGGAVDDTYGVAFINDDELNKKVRSTQAQYVSRYVHGVGELQLIRDNCYKYSTMYPEWLD